MVSPPETRANRVWSHPRNHGLAAFGLTLGTADWPHLVSAAPPAAFGLSLPWGTKKIIKNVDPGLISFCWEEQNELHPSLFFK